MRPRINYPASIIASLVTLGLWFQLYNLIGNIATSKVAHTNYLVRQAITISAGNDGIWSRDEKRKLLDSLGMERVPLGEKGTLFFVPERSHAKV